MGSRWYWWCHFASTSLFLRLNARFLCLATICRPEDTECSRQLKTLECHRRIVTSLSSGLERRHFFHFSLHETSCLHFCPVIIPKTFTASSLHIFSKCFLLSFSPIFNSHHTQFIANQPLYITGDSFHHTFLDYQTFCTYHNCT